MPELQGFHILHCTALHGGTNSVLQCCALVYCFVLSKIFAIKLHLLGGSPCPVPYWPSQGGWITLVTRGKPLQVPPAPHHGVQGAKPSEQPTPHQPQGSLTGVPYNTPTPMSLLYAPVCKPGAPTFSPFHQTPDCHALSAIVSPDMVTVCREETSCHCVQRPFVLLVYFSFC